MQAAEIILRWLLLGLSPALAYVFARPALTLAQLGAPWHDWGWYAVLSLALAVTPAAAGWYGRLNRRALLGALAAAAVLIASAGAFGYGEHVPIGAAPVPIAFFVFHSFPQQAPGAVLADVHAAGGTLYLHPGRGPFDEAFRQELVAGLQRLDRHGIGAYVLVPAADFLSAPVYQEWCANLEALAALLEREHLPNVRGLFADAESPFFAAPEKRQASSYAQARDGLAACLAATRQAHPGLPIGVTATWPLYFDGADGDADLAAYALSPVDPPGGWSFVNIQAYSSYIPAPDRAYYVYSVERAFARRYPNADRSELIGLVGAGMPGEPLLDFATLVRDARLSRALGSREIVVFQLDGALAQFGDDFVRRFTAAVDDPAAGPVAVPFSRSASSATYGLGVADAALDLRGPLGLAWLAWAWISARLLWRKARKG